MSRFFRLSFLGLAGLLSAVSAAPAQPYIGFVYPAGAQQGTTVQVRLGGQRIEGVQSLHVSGTGVTAKYVDYHRALGVTEAALLRENLNALRREAKERAKEKKPPLDELTQKIITNIEERMAAYEIRPANRAIVNLAFFEVTEIGRASGRERV